MADPKAQAEAAPTGPVGDQSAQNVAPGAGAPAADAPVPDVQIATPASDDPSPSDEQRAVTEEENQARAENPNAVISRAANPAFGGEGFDYGGRS